MYKMPIMRRRFMRKRRIPRNKMIRRRRVARPIAAARNLHYFKRTVRLTDLLASATALTNVPIANAYSFNLNQLPNPTEFTNLFDQYKITGAKLVFTPGANNALYSPLSGQSVAFGFNRFMSVIDYDDSSIPASESELMQYNTLKVTPPMRTHTRYLKPKILEALYNGTLSTAYQAARPGWVDVGNPSVPHYGVKVYCAAPTIAGSTSSSITYNVYLTLYFACKNVR